MLIALEELAEHAVRFDEVFAPGHIDYATEGLRQAGSLKVRGTASLLDKDIHLRGHLGTEMEALCARCLEPVHEVVERDFDLFYHPLADCPRGEELVVPKGQEELGFYQGPGLLLEEVAKEQVLLALPMRSICRKDCRGLCPHCGRNLIRESCDCESRTADARWEGLSKLNRK